METIYFTVCEGVAEQRTRDEVEQIAHDPSNITIFCFSTTDKVKWPAGRILSARVTGCAGTWDIYSTHVVLGDNDSIHIYTFADKTKCYTCDHDLNEHKSCCDLCSMGICGDCRVNSKELLILTYPAGITLCYKCLPKACPHCLELEQQGGDCASCNLPRCEVCTACWKCAAIYDAL